MNYRTTCDHCGAVITAYTLPMTEGLCRAFLQLAKIATLTGKPVAKSQLKLDNVQYTMFQKLRHFGLITPAPGRAWSLTPEGVAWYLGKSVITTPAAWMGGVTLGENHPAWSTHDKPRKPITVYDVCPDEWKQRADYVAEKVGS